VRWLRAIEHFGSSRCRVGQLRGRDRDLLGMLIAGHLHFEVFRLLVGEGVNLFVVQNAGRPKQRAVGPVDTHDPVNGRASALEEARDANLVPR
jgi:hypothetical protein